MRTRIAYRSLRSRCSSVTLVALRSCRTSVASVALGTLWTLRAGVAYRTLRTNRTNIALRSNRTNIASVTLDALLTLRPLRACRPHRTLIALWPLRTGGGACVACRTNWSSRATWTGNTLRTWRTNGTFITLRTLRTLRWRIDDDNIIYVFIFCCHQDMPADRVQWTSFADFTAYDKVSTAYGVLVRVGLTPPANLYAEPHVVSVRLPAASCTR